MLEGSRVVGGIIELPARRRELRPRQRQRNKHTMSPRPTPHPYTVTVIFHRQRLARDNDAHRRGWPAMAESPPFRAQ